MVGAALCGLGGPALAETYTVRAGDTLYGVAARAGVSAADVARLSGLSSLTLRPGQVLRLPERSGPVGGAPVVRAASLRASVPKVDASRVTGPVAWPSAPQATMASYVGWLPDGLSGGELPVRTYLQGLSFHYQTLNNCGPSALSAVLGFYRVEVGQAAIARTARPGGGYMQISAIAPELEKFGLRTVTIRGGQLGQVRRLLALGIPVIVLQWFDRPGHIPHFRVVRGYDDQAGLFWVSDSMVGPVTYLSYRSFDVLWNTQGRQAFPVYPKAYDADVRSIMARRN